MTDLVQDTWKEIGHSLRAVGYRLIVRTKPHIRKTAGGILWLPPKLQDFHGELPHLVEIQATVLSAGPVGVAAEFKPGDVVGFKRLHFGFWYKVGAREDQEYVGFLDANQVLYYVDEDADDATSGTAASTTGRGRKRTRGDAGHVQS